MVGHKSSLHHIGLALPSTTRGENSGWIRIFFKHWAHYASRVWSVMTWFVEIHRNDLGLIFRIHEALNCSFFTSHTGCQETHTIAKNWITRYYTLLNHLLRRWVILTHTNPRNVPEIPTSLYQLYQLGTSSPSTDPTNPTKPPSDPQASGCRLCAVVARQKHVLPRRGSGFREALVTQQPDEELLVFLAVQVGASEKAPRTNIGCY